MTDHARETGRRRPAAVLWDMDGTIVDTEEHWIAAAAEIVRGQGIEPPPGALDALVGMALPDGAELVRRLGVDLPVHDIVERQIGLALRNTAVGGIAWRPGALRMLAALRTARIPRALVTMSYRAYADRIVAALPPGMFDVVVTGDDVEHGKPAPDAYLRAMRMLGVSAADCVAIEDSVVGLAAARAAGAHTIGVPHHSPLAAGAADAIWPTLSDRGLVDLYLPAVRPRTPPPIA